MFKQFELSNPIWRHWWEEFAKDHLLARFDERGCGLSNWTVDDLSFEAKVSDLDVLNLC